MFLYAVTFNRDYQDEAYFGTGGLFLTQEEAEKFIQSSIDDIVSGKEKYDHELFYGEDDEFADDIFINDKSIDDGAHYFRWEIDYVLVDDRVGRAIYECMQRQYAKEDVVNNIDEFFDSDNLDKKPDSKSTLDNIIESATDKYLRAKEDDDSWWYKVQNAVRDAVDEYTVGRYEEEK